MGSGRQKCWEWLPCVSGLASYWPKVCVEAGTDGRSNSKEISWICFIKCSIWKDVYNLYKVGQLNNTGLKNSVLISPERIYGCMAKEIESYLDVVYLGYDYSVRRRGDWLGRTPKSNGWVMEHKLPTGQNLWKSGKPRKECMTRSMLGR